MEHYFGLCGSKPEFVLCQRIFGITKVYAVGTYVDPLAMSMIKSQGEDEIKKALLDPSYPRTIRIVMNRNLSIDKYTMAIIEALEPRMNGLDDGSLVEFKKLNPPVDLVQGAEMEMTIRGDTLLYKNAVGGLGQVSTRDVIFANPLKLIVSSFVILTSDFMTD